MKKRQKKQLSALEAKMLENFQVTELEQRLEFKAWTKWDEGGTLLRIPF